MPHAWKCQPNRLLFGALGVYGLLAIALSVCQSGYVNADFVGYSTVAHRLLAQPASSVSGYWSPLFSWCMSALFYPGLSDLVAGRVVLLLSGICYVVMIYHLALRFAPRAHPVRLVFLAGMSACAALQGALWATYLLDPDLLANAVLFSYFVLLLDTDLRSKPLRSFGAGMCAGLAYLAKGYMLPFVLVHLPVSLFLASRFGRRENETPDVNAVTRSRGGWLRTSLLVGLGLAVVAGPWIAVLSAHYGHFTFATAGPANHANVSPENFRHDPLWNPPLESDFILDPHFGPDWSPFQSLHHFRHQLYLVVHNTWTLLGHIAGWIAMLVIAVFCYIRVRRSVSKATSCGVNLQGICFAVVTTVIYCSGYVMVSLEARYIVPTLAPLLCLSSFMLFSASLTGRDGFTIAGASGARAFMLGILLVVPFSIQDLYRIKNVALKHSQATPLAPNLHIATELRQAGLFPGRFAASDWHRGLEVAYAADAVSLYMGRPLAVDPVSRSRELQAAGVRTYLDFHGGADSAPSLDSHWQRVTNIAIVPDVYVLKE